MVEEMLAIKNEANKDNTLQNSLKKEGIRLDWTTGLD